MSDPQEKIVEIGSKVTIEMNDKVRTITIVNTSQPSSDSSSVSIEAPVAKVILGARKGDTLNFISPSGKLIYIKIIEIE